MTLHRTAVLFGAILSAGIVMGQPGGGSPADMKEIRDYRLNMDVIQRYVRLFKTLNDDAAVKKCSDFSSSGTKVTSLDDSEKALSSCPAAVADIKAAGMKPREFLVVTGALMSDFMAVGMKKSGMIKDYPPTVSPENAAFLEQNYDKLQAMMGSLSGKK
jgi:hypothetical protein